MEAIDLFNKKKKVKEKLWKIKNNLEWYNGDEIMDILHEFNAEVGEKVWMWRVGCASLWLMIGKQHGLVSIFRAVYGVQNKR